MNLIKRRESLYLASREILTNISDLEQMTDEILRRVIGQVLHGYQERLNVGIQDSALDILNTVKDRLTKAVLAKVNNVQSHDDSMNKMLLPAGCRHFVSNSKRTIFVVEQPPQIRSIKLNESLTKTIGTNYPLAMPYSIFIVVIKDRSQPALHYGWLGNRLKSLDDTMSLPLLPNVHKNHLVCQAKNWTPESFKKSYAERAEEVITTFWTSWFNDDLSHEWDTKGVYDERLSDHLSWEKHSKEDPLFILEVAKNLPKTHSVYNFIKRMDEETEEESNIRHQITETVDRFSEEFFNKIMQFFKKTKATRYAPKDLQEALKSSLDQMLAEVTAVVTALEFEVSNIKAGPKEIVSSSEYWTNDCY